MTVVVACCFPDGDLPSSWFRLYQRLKVAVSRAGIDADVRLVSLPLLTDDAAVIVVPPDLEAAASGGQSSGRHVRALGERDAEGLRALIESLPSIGAGPAPVGTQFAHHRGFRLMATRVADASAIASG